MAHVAPFKKRLVEDLAARCAQAQVVGIVNIHGIPAPQFQAIRKKLGGRATTHAAVHPRFPARCRRGSCPDKRGRQR